MLIQKFFSIACLSAVGTALALPATQAAIQANNETWDAIIVGGGPAGLSALSGLARVRRRAIMIDSGDYRNGATRHMHDVVGLDGVTPAYFRWLARSKLSFYDSISMTNGTVTNIEYHNTTGNPSFSAKVTCSSGEEVVLTARSIVLATGLQDIIPDTPGLQENWGQGIYWCPWCDGYEHADQALGLITDLTGVAGLAREVSTQNSDVVAFVNGTDTTENRIAAESSFPDWETYLTVNDVKVYNQTITSITRLASGLNASANPSEPTHPEYDLFRVDLDDGTSVERAAFLVEFPDEQKSSLGQDMGVTLTDGRFGEVTKGYITNIPMTYAAGDITLDRSTNVPHAMYSGKRAAVYLHVALARQESSAEIAAAKSGNGTIAIDKRISHQELDVREVWKEMDGPAGSLFHSGDFDSLN